MVRRHQNGFSYAETLLAVAVLAVALVPALRSLQLGYTGALVQADVVQQHQQLLTRMEAMVNTRFVDLDTTAQAAGSPTTPSSYSDGAGAPNRVVVFLSRYDGDDLDGDGDPFTGTDEGLLWVQVAIENSPYQLTTLIAR